jgi:hypothetical protein
MTSFLFTNGGFHKVETRWIEQIIHDTEANDFHLVGALL